MRKSTVTLRVMNDQVVIERAGAEPQVLRDVMAVFSGHSGRLKIFGIGQTRAELETAPLSEDERTALNKCAFLPAFKAHDFSVIRFEAFLRWVYFNHLFPGVEQFARPVLKVEAPELESLPPEQRREAAHTLRKFGNPAYLNGRRIF